MRVLLDTCVLSELQRPRGDPRPRARVAALDPDQIFLSVITVGELTKGVALLPAGERQRQLAAWLLGLEQRFAAQIPAGDGLIAATARRHGLHIMTRNTKHFAATGAPIIDPWEG